MMLASAAAVLIFVAVFTIIVGIWWARMPSSMVRQRLAAGSVAFVPEHDLLRSDVNIKLTPWERFVRRSDLVKQAGRLAQQAGSKQTPGDVVLMMTVFALVGAVLGWWRMDNAGGAVLAAVIAGALPALYLVYARRRRMQRFEEHFADAVDMISRAIRAGHALSAAIQLVGDEMADPVGQEFRFVTESIRLGVEPGEALSNLAERMPTEDVRFFCAAINIQRGAGGNLAEILDRLSDVIRKRFELLSHARVLSAQQRYAAVFVGFSPLIFSIIFYFLAPGYFDPLIESPMAPMLVTAGLSLELVGGVIIWRLSKIKV